MKQFPTLTSFFAVIIISVATLPLAAQNTITFKVNLKPQLEDSIFVPGRDVALLEGNVFPLTPTNRVQLTEGSEVDSIYTVDVNFPFTAINKELKYTYILKTAKKEITEMNPRFLKIRKGDRELDALYFDTFAW